MMGGIRMDGWSPRYLDRYAGHVYKVYGSTSFPRGCRQCYYCSFCCFFLLPHRVCGLYRRAAGMVSWIFNQDTCIRSNNAFS